MGAYYDYCRSKSDKDFAKLYDRMEYIVVNKIINYGFRGAIIDDIKQEVFEKLIKAADDYDPSIIPDNNFCYMIINRAIASYIQKINFQKRKIMSEAASLDMSIEGDDGIENYTLYEMISNDEDIEQDVIVNIDYIDLVNQIKNSLTTMELEIFEVDLRTKGLSGQCNSKVKQIEKSTPYNWKQIDNALQRIRGKIKKLINNRN